jgi:hypothetical protein
MILSKNSKTLVQAGYSPEKGKVLTFSCDEILENFETQEKNDPPHYKLSGKCQERGFLIWSLQDGCGVAFRRPDGNVYLVRGFQGDFVYC